MAAAASSQLLQLIDDLIKRGMTPEMIANTLGKGGLKGAVGSLAHAGDGNRFRRVGMGILETGLGVAALPVGLGLSGFLSPTGSTREAESTSGMSGGYVIPASMELELQRDARAHAARSAPLNFLLERLGLPTIETPSAASRMESMLENRERQGRDMTDRQKEIIALERGMDIEKQRLIEEALTRRAELQAAADVQRQRTASLGEVQRQRLESSYGMTQGILENAINSVVGATALNDRAPEVELARIQ